MLNLAIADMNEGFRMIVDADCPLVGNTLLNTHSWDPHITALVKAVLKPGQTAVDVGANLGYYSLLFDKLVGPQGRVVAIEPVAQNVCILELNRLLNGAHYEIIGCGVSDTQETLFLQITGSVGYPSGWQQDKNAMPNIYEFMSRSVPIFALPLDALLAHVPSVDLIKMDVEGYEIKALTSAQRTLHKNLPTIICEVNPHWLKTVSQSGVRELCDYFFAFDAYHIWILGQHQPMFCGRDLGLIETTLGRLFAEGLGASDLMITTEARVAHLITPLS